MRTSILSRSVIAVASLAIGSAALAATPAVAAPDAITRDLVLALVQNESSSDDERRLAALACDLQDGDDNYIQTLESTPFVTDNADGVLMSVRLRESVGGENIGRWCTFAAMITTDGAFTLSGNAQLSVTADEPQVAERAADPVDQTVPLSGNLFVTDAINSSSDFSGTASFTTLGHATRSVSVTTSEHVTVPKPKSQAVVTKYAKRLKAAKKWYAKKIAKAGNSRAKKAAANKTYAAKKAAYKKAYEKTYSMGKAVPKTITQVENRPFAVAADHSFYYAE